MNPIELALARMNQLIESHLGGKWMNPDMDAFALDDKELQAVQLLFDHQMPADLSDFYRTYGPFKSEGFICPMDLRLPSEQGGSIGLMDQLKRFFGKDYFPEREDEERINQRYLCVGRMWLEDDTEEIHCFFFDQEQANYGRFYHHQDNGQDIDTFGLSKLLGQGRIFPSMEALIANEIEHARIAYLASSYKPYVGKDLGPYVGDLIEIGLMDIIAASLYSVDHQPWAGIDRKVRQIMGMFSGEEIMQINQIHLSIGWYHRENGDLVFLGKNMDEFVLNINEATSLQQRIKNLQVKEQTDLPTRLEGIGEFTCICQ